MQKSVSALGGSFQSRSLLKILMIMKLTLIFVLFAAFQVKAFDVSGQTVTLNFKQTEIRKVLNALEKESNYNFLYNYELKALRNKVDFKVENLPINAALDQLFANSGLTYKMMENNLVVVLSTNAEENADIRITGRVTGENDDPLAGVSVREEGTSNGTVTDNNGNFALTVKDNATLEVSYIGYITQRVTLKEEPVVNIKLVASNTQMDQVVVIGYGSQSRKNVTSAISTVTAKDFENRPVYSTAQAIQGKAAGVQVSQPSGKPGTEFSVRIRGTNSINANNDPLYVIDGIPTTDTRGLNPNDIETIQILKDAASAAIYGARASNGVVLITTKRGKANRSGVSFNTYVGFSKLANNISVLNADQYKQLAQEIPNVGAVPPGYDANTDWQAETFKTGINQNYQLAFNGGSDKSQYYLSLGYLKDEGMVEPASFDRYSGRLNLDHKVTSWLKIGTNINYIMSRTRNAGDNASSGRGGIIMAALNTPPVLGIYKNDGSGQFEQNPFQASWESPVAYMSRDEKTTDNRFLANFNADVRIIPGLNYKMNLGTDISNSQYDFYVDPNRTVYGRQNHGVANISRSNYFSWLWENTLGYNKSFGVNNFNALLGISAQENNYGYSYVNTHDLPTAGVQTTNAGNILDGAGNTKTVSALVSQFARFMFDHDNKYLFTAAFRRDGSSKLAEDNKWDYFPSFSAGWRLSQEKFMENVKGINDLKLRVGWGQTGNQEGLSDFQVMGLLDFERVTPGSSLNGPAVKRYSIANPDLKWEKTTQTNIGVDLTFLDNRITFTTDVYWKQTNDLILAIDLPSNVGAVQPFYRNDGVLENRGVEFSVTSKNVANKSLTWNTDFNISFNKNEVTELGLQKIYDYAPIYSNNQNAIRVTTGQPLGAFFGYVAQGVDPATGNIIFEDLDKNGLITPDDRTFIGYAAPKFTYGMTNTLTWKNFDFSIFFQGVQGNDIFNATRVDLEGMFDSKNQSTVVLDRWKQAGDVTDIPRSGNIDNVRNSTRFVENGSYFRIKSATLAYNFSGSLLKNAGLKRTTLYVTAQNLLTITNYKGFDPEVNTYGVNSRGTEFGVDYGTYPQTRQIVFGLNLDF